MKDIFDECQFGEFKLKSRIIRTGGWERDTEDGGFLKPKVFDRYEKMAGNEVGLIVSEMFALDPKDRFYPYCANMNYKGFIKDYKQVTNLSHHFEVPILGQLAFFFFDDGTNQKAEPNDISLEGIRKLQAEVVMAAKKFSFAGFDGIQINMAHNFYLARFINPYFNQRTDDYGGSTEKRMRIVVEIIKLIKKMVGCHVSFRINAVDGRKGGMTLDESFKIAKILAEAGADSVQITARTISFKFGETGDHAFLSYADRMAKELDIPVILGGTLRDMKTMNEILNETDIEFLSLAKPFVAQQDFLSEWKENGDGVSRCRACNNCYGKKESNCFQFGDE
ncbi:NADH-dependent flavin oxidoreductase [Methanobrevibacter ruminantium M1]|uniref:NADH-dependent flavin oxidoreductase n=1 Tax=Methanobrevibacter ruminantium (strain ATCC 35063 / DSM 1093 / JCM 13430 / OCM 146 / M1) TaxID=634498 RepID=D3DZ57_METRM|nr:NADH-dependent flavin oxidoreductase [Methanobrevibacter ruminantium]ADC47607.1 NADH-dependent flavin oxidoreductase [Methanobrevibacter ruminantium M1]